MRPSTLLAGAAGMLAGIVTWQLLHVRPGDSKVGFSPDMNAVRPISSRKNVWIEQLTWMEVRDEIRSGARTVIVPTGGIEQNGPYVVTGKHNIILRATAEAIAQKLGKALVAPVIPYVPEGSIEPKKGHMRYPGSIGIEDATYQMLLTDVARSLRANGFQLIVFIGDSGGNQKGMKTVAASLNEAWAGGAAKALFVPEYYDWPGRQKWLAERGYREVDEGYHDELSVESIMLTVDPDSVRMKERIAAARFSINGVSLAPVETTTAVGRALTDHISEVTVDAIVKRRAKLIDDS